MWRYEHLASLMVCLFYPEKLFFKLAVGHPKNKKYIWAGKKHCSTWKKITEVHEFWRIWHSVCYTWYHQLIFGIPPYFLMKKKIRTFFYHNSDFPRSYIHSRYKTHKTPQKIWKNVFIQKLISYSDSTPNFTLKLNFWWLTTRGDPLYWRGWV